MAETKLQEYCLLAKGSRGRTLADILQRATADPVLFAFGELLALPSVQQVRMPGNLLPASPFTECLL